jgi:hypothetical protein
MSRLQISSCGARKKTKEADQEEQQSRSNNKSKEMECTQMQQMRTPKQQQQLHRCAFSIPRKLRRDGLHGMSKSAVGFRITITCGAMWHEFLLPVQFSADWAFRLLHVCLTPVFSLSVPFSSSFLHVHLLVIVIIITFFFQ